MLYRCLMLQFFLCQTLTQLYHHLQYLPNKDALFYFSIKKHNQNESKSPHHSTKHFKFIYFPLLKNPS